MYGFYIFIPNKTPATLCLSLLSQPLQVFLKSLKKFKKHPFIQLNFVNNLKNKVKNNKVKSK